MRRKSSISLIKHLEDSEITRSVNKTDNVETAPSAVADVLLQL